ncbi:MAG: polysaccharide deacetylase family protein [Humidesulfovibrio sp.]|nr:polysaccharide deacetylase family protein [Humidesulfovibrio sp.]
MKINRSTFLLLGIIILGLNLAFCALAQAEQPQEDVLDAGAFARQERHGHSCAITFDDGPNKHTAELLDILKGRGIHATFFVLGENVEKEPDLVRRMAQEGHEVDNHSFDHPKLRALNAQQQWEEIEHTERLLKGLGVVPKFFRPPYGSYNAETVRDAARDNLVLVLWSVDSLDWKYRTVHDIEAHVVPKTPSTARGIFLFHDIHETTVTAMPDILDKLAKSGCSFVTLSQWLALHPDAAKQQQNGK